MVEMSGKKEKKREKTENIFTKIKSFFYQKKNSSDERKNRQLKYDFMPDILEIIEKPAGRGGKIIIWSSFLFVTIAVIWAAVSKTDVVVTAQGSILPIEGIESVQMPYSGMIKEVKISNGDYVAEGQILAYVEADYADVEEEALQNTIDRLKQENKVYQMIIDGKSLDGISAEDVISEGENVEGENVEGENVEDGINNIENMVDDEELKYILSIDISYIIEQEKIYQDSLKQIEDEERKSEIVKQHYVETLSKINSNNIQIQELNLSLQKASKTAERQELRAVRSGIVTGLTDGLEGMTVDAGAVIMYVVPKDTEMEVEALVSTSDIGNIKVGDAVAIKVSAYPYTEYGLVKGELIYISDTALGDSNGNYGYKARVKITSKDLQDRNIKLVSGMLTVIEIKTGRRSVMNYFLEPLKKNVSNAMKER